MPAPQQGPIGKRIARNVAELRAARGLSLREMSERMGKLGRPTLSTGIMKIEDGTRRVDVDDLVALALALDVTPNRLLLPPEAGTDKGVDLTPAVTAPTEDAAWRWAVGEYALFPLDAPTPAADVVKFMAANRPHASTNLSVLEQEIAAHLKDLKPVARAARAAEQAGVPFRVLLDYLRLTDALNSTDDN
ncbi:helix-turn-helix transcriptional regulator [Nonomuraea sp. NPDC050404]|uniref:helix-turn-helix domain-containing protein n=1 Tax=Nonomuraea sp. NPDC050404 TaxID=3155783 RepID=UPI0033ECE990